MVRGVSRNAAEREREQSLTFRHTLKSTEEWPIIPSPHYENYRGPVERNKFIPLLLLYSFLRVGVLYGQELPISVYGYLDLVARDFGKRQYPNGANENPPPTFLLLRTHILLNSNFAERWQAFTNVRFQSGANIGSERFHDNKGQVELLEAWFEYRVNAWLYVRGGQFLAPFGYFNPRKFQSPIFNSVVLPVMYEEEFLRRASAGTIIPPLQNLQIWGKWLAKNWTLGYHVYAGNGSNTDSNNLDINENKALGVRLWVEPTIHNLTVGVSYYREKGNFSIRPHLDMKAMMQHAQAEERTIDQVLPILPQVEEQELRRTLGIDVRFLWQNLEMRGEFVRSFISDLSLMDATTISDTTASYTFDPSDFNKTFYYVNINYTFLDKWTPYFELNVFEDPRHFVFRNRLIRSTLGVAFRPHPQVALKAEYHLHAFGERYNKPPMDFKSFPMYWLAASIFFN